MTSTVSNKRKKGRRSRRRVHRGRMTLVLSILLAIVMGVMFAVSRCGTEPVEIFVPEETVEHTAPADAGRRDAEEALRHSPGSMERQAVLMRIHSREWDLRRAGFPHSADQYIKAARQRLGSGQQ